MLAVGLRLLLLAGVAGCALSAVGQVAGPVIAATGADAAYVPTMTFDVTSVRQVKVEGTSASVGKGRNDPHSSLLQLESDAIQNLVYRAYPLGGDRVHGWPDWPSPTLFKVDAKSDSEADAKLAKLSDRDALAEKQHMLQGLLADRFKLRVHWETREGPTYNLLVAKAGRLEGAKGPPPLNEQQIKDRGDRPMPTLWGQNDGAGVDLVGQACSMTTFAQELSGDFGRPVADKTGRAGKYDFLLKYGKVRAIDRKPDEDDPMPSLEEAIQDQLGLKLEPAKGPIRVLVIDYVEKPSDN